MKRPRKDVEDNSSLSNSSGSDELSNDDDNESSSSVESGLVYQLMYCYIMRASLTIRIAIQTLEL